MKKKPRVPKPIRNPVAEAVLLYDVRAAIRADVANLKTAAELQAWTGSSAANLISNAGRMLWIVLGAALSCGVDKESADVRILRGLGEVLGDLQADGRIEQHRASIQAGLLAAERLLPMCSDISMAAASYELDGLLSTARGMGTADLAAMLERVVTAA